MAGVTATLAFVGAAGLMTGVLDPGDIVTDRIPFGSKAFGGFALALIVGIPMALTTPWRSPMTQGRPPPRSAPGFFSSRGSLSRQSSSKS
ncbi:hypothetical protein [Antrihabitans stalactiti]|uniref:Uncharacterized protein n=1 Tax=Antrihabitans stalactiti TaxID=2584121 RepID=A0A848KCS9_9NOCA|nr:hypothetical protein [Antrihabitans stalactiti]NMN93950.1 hypothetical protein [Antrihabitans stalactiti]